MADDNILRSYRSSEPARRTSASAGPRDVGGNDPLAELARLIGQSDPFSEPDRGGGYVPESRPRTDSSPSDWRKTAAAMARESMRATPVADPHFDQLDSAVAAARALRASPDDQPHYQAHSVHAGYDQAADPEVGYADSGYDEEPHGGLQMDERRHAHPQAVAQGDHESENYFFDGAPVPSDERVYDDPPRARATNSLVTVAVLIGCGILGTAGAYGYRTYHSGTGPTDAPIISADKTPNKVVPAAAGGDQQGKSVERVGAANERVVPRQEEPVTLPDPSSQRGVLPAPFTTSPGPGPSVQTNAAPQSAPAGTEPKKVRTVLIRPDGIDPMARPVTGMGTAPQSAPSQPVATTRQTPAAKPAPAPAPASARNGGGPLSLEPQAGDAAPSTPPAPRAAAAAPKLASVAPAASGASGGYVVQISSQRSEADAQASFRSLQSKYPSQLGDREAIVRRADLGPKGVFYRAMVGPFGSAGDADQFCGGLKAAGGQCIVQRN